MPTEIAVRIAAEITKRRTAFGDDCCARAKTYSDATSSH